MDQVKWWQRPFLAHWPQIWHVDSTLICCEKSSHAWSDWSIFSGGICDSGPLEQIGDQTIIRRLRRISLWFRVTWWVERPGQIKEIVCAWTTGQMPETLNMFPPFILPGFTAESLWPSGSERELSRTEMFFQVPPLKLIKQKADTRSLAALFSQRSSWETHQAPLHCEHKAPLSCNLVY